MSAEQEFKEGTVVQLKSGGPAMTINGIIMGERVPKG